MKTIDENELNALRKMLQLPPHLRAVLEALRDAHEVHIWPDGEEGFHLPGQGDCQICKIIRAAELALREVFPMQFTIMGPDDLPLRAEPFNSRQEAEEFIPKWCARYQQQGYYSGVGRRISLEDLPNLCRIEVVDSHGVLADGPPSDDQISQMTANVVRHLNGMGTEASHEFQDTIFIPVAGRDNHWTWVFGTANEYWGGDLCLDSEPQDGGTTLPFLSTHISDGRDVAEFIHEIVRDRPSLTLEIDGVRWTGTAADFVASNYLAAPAEILPVLRLLDGEEWSIGGGAAATVHIKRVAP